MTPVPKFALIIREPLRQDVVRVVSLSLIYNF
jgi:hypothetical protein